MFRIFTVSIVLFLTVFSSIAQFNDDFTDGDFVANPTWTGDLATFTVASGQLQSQSAVAATYYLGTASTITTNVEWEFFFDFQFATSGSNYTNVYLMSDNSNLALTSNGYFIKLGGTADEISLYKIISGVETVIIDGADGLINSSTSNPFNVKVSRDATDNWTIQYDDLGSSPTGGYVGGGSVNDNSVNTASTFGFLITQSSAASAVNNHFFDDITVNTIAPDVVAPTVSSVNVTSSTTLEVLFDEPVDVTSAQTLTNYSADNGIGNPSVATVNGGNPAQVDLTFSAPFTQAITNNLTVSNVADLSSNIMTSSSHPFLYFVPVNALVGDVLINEVFPDPSPQIGLPEAEFIEIINNSTVIFDLANWTVSDGSSNGTLPSYLLMPGEVVAIADDAFIFDFSIFPNIIFVTTLPSLNNTGDDVILTDNNGLQIDMISYTDGWYGDGNKDDGGYSLELINPTLPCSGAANWSASNDVNGGTPGTQNSVYNVTPDTDIPAIVSASVLSNIEIEICFNEGIDTLGLTTGAFAINNGLNVSFFSVSGDLTCVTLTTSPALDTGTIYTVTINGVNDCSGNTVSNAQADVVLPNLPEAGDLIINEVLFNPFTGGDDFVEIYNNSNKYIDLFGFMLADWDDGIIDNFKSITEHRLISPGDFIVLTKDSSDIKASYLNAVTGSFVEMSTLPSYPDDSATVYLSLPDSSISDYYHYDNDYHFALIKDDDGVSLERLDYNRSSQDESNWHSGAENAGWATPGAQNSQYFPGMITSDMISTSPEIFSPDNDGYEDVLNISYALDGPGYVGNITIFDREGRIVKDLLRNELLTAEGIYTWDGTTNSREKAPIGVYVIYFEVFNLEGVVSGVKKSTVLGGRF
ncbi:MAG: hypothetical protein ACI9N1_002483 [Flavobacteriales bacterium]|jgi:hypothetical protein